MKNYADFRALRVPDNRRGVCRKVLLREDGIHA